MRSGSRPPNGTDFPSFLGSGPAASHPPQHDPNDPIQQKQSGDHEAYRTTHRAPIHELPHYQGDGHQQREDGQRRLGAP